MRQYVPVIFAFFVTTQAAVGQPAPRGQELFHADEVRVRALKRSLDSAILAVGRGGDLPQAELAEDIAVLVDFAERGELFGRRHSTDLRIADMDLSTSQEGEAIANAWVETRVGRPFAGKPVTFADLTAEIKKFSKVNCTSAPDGAVVTIRDKDGNRVRVAAVHCVFETERDVHGHGKCTWLRGFQVGIHPKGPQISSQDRNAKTGEALVKT
jgi:hypothetical protein